MPTQILKQESYTYGKCECCNKKFTRSTRGIVMGLGIDGKYYNPDFITVIDSHKEYKFSNVPVQLVRIIKLGKTCYQKWQDSNKD